jgi:putative tryptophan/tyrosine transport system substrate-binding protein
VTGRLLAALLVGLFTAPLIADAQPAGKLHRIGVLDSVDATANADNLGALRQGLAVLGYVEGQSFVFEYRSADGRPERFNDLAVELVQLNVDVIVTRGAPATFAARQATQSIPIVMASISHPVFEGLVTNLTRPGGNITGLYATAPIELGGERLRLLKEALPGASRIGVLWNPGDLRAPLVAKDTERIARSLGVRIEHLDLQRAEPLEALFESALYRRIDALITVEDAFTVAYRARILEFAAISRLPSMHGLREFVEEGGLMSYGTDRRDLYRRAAGYIHRIFSGASPGDLPVEPAIKFELVVNLKTARTLGVTIPPALLRRADHVIP